MSMNHAALQIFHHNVKGMEATVIFLSSIILNIFDTALWTLLQYVMDV